MQLLWIRITRWVGLRGRNTRTPLLRRAVFSKAMDTGLPVIILSNKVISTKYCNMENTTYQEIRVV